MIDKKKNGVYYTPSFLAKFLVNNVFQVENFNEEINILEPSCGDGVFVKYLLEKKDITRKKMNLYLVEKNKEELNKIKEFITHDSDLKVHYLNEDFLHFQKKNDIKYDLVIGNPPYINKKYLSQEQIELCNEILLSAGLTSVSIKNIWIAFLVRAISLLKQDGKICFVVPSELMQVNHSEPLREYLLKNFNLIELITFNEIIFPNTEQDTIVIIGTKKSSTKGLKLYKAKNLESLSKFNEVACTHVKVPDGQEKWTKYFLSEKEIIKIEYLKNKFKRIREYCDSSVGIVTAANDFFIVNESIVQEYELDDLVVPILKKSSVLSNTIRVTKEDFKGIVNNGLETNLIVFGNRDMDEYNYATKRYLDEGIQKRIDQRFKCKQRSKWYDVPLADISEGMFFKRCNIFPKLIVNEANVYTTDSAYRVNMKSGYDIKSFVFSFYNSLTLIYSELYGRSYGGGVLELTPNEFKKLPIPYIPVSDIEFNELDRMMRNNLPIGVILKYTNNIILKNNFGINDNDINLLSELYVDLVNRRLKTNKISIFLVEVSIRSITFFILRLVIQYASYS